MKNIFKRQKIIIIAAIAFIMTSAHINLMAETDEGQESTVDIEFIEGDAQVSPVDPEDPSTSGNGGTEDSGSLALNYVTPLTFGKQMISPYVEEYPTLTPKACIQVTDFRGTGDGWEVTACASKFQNNGVDTLLGSTITFTSGAYVTTTTQIPPPTPSPRFELKTDGVTKVKVVEAAKYSGMGTWLIKWYTDPEAEKNYSIILTVPSGAGLINSNTAKISWLLTSAPAS